METLAALEERLRLLEAREEATIERVDLLIEIIDALGSNDPERMLALCREVIDLSERLSYERGKGYGLGYMGFACHLLSRHEEAYARLREAIPLMEGVGDSTGQAMALGALAGVQLSLGDCS